MKIFRPLHLGVLTRTFENDGKHHLVVTLLVGFQFDGELVAEPKIWDQVQSFIPDAVLDELMPKSRGELLVHGNAHPPGGEMATACRASVELGSIEKAVYAVGDRHWTVQGASAPKPFSAMPITWERAYGGAGVDDNPLGLGSGPIEGPEGKVHPLPNIEDPDALIQAKSDAPRPVSLSRVASDHPARRAKLGTYDQKWLETRFPGFAADIDWEHFQCAPTDQRLADGFFRGDEELTVENMHPATPRQKGALPSVKTRVFATQGEQLVEIGTRLDTVVLFPGAAMGACVFRGVLEVECDDASDVVEIIAGVESLDGDKPRAHYEEALELRHHPEHGAIYALRDRDLLPADCRPLLEIDDETALKLRPQGLLEANLRRRAEVELARARQVLADNELVPDDHLPRALPPKPDAPKLDELPEVLDDLAEQMANKAKEAETEREKAMERARKACESVDVDFDELMKKAEQDRGGPPPPVAPAVLERLQDQLQLSINAGVPLPAVEAVIADPKLADKLTRMDALQLDAYRKFAHFMPAARRQDDEAGRRLRQDVLAAIERGESLAERDLTGAPLAGIRFAGIDMRRALLEAADLAGSDLSGADLEGAVLVRSDLTDANLAGTKLAGANLGGAKLNNARCDAQTILDEAELSECDLTGAAFAGTALQGAELRGAHFEDTDFSGANLAKMQLVEADLTGATFRDADLSEATFVDVNLRGVDFGGAVLRGTTFLTCPLGEANFAGADAENLRVLKDSDCTGAKFTGATLSSANFGGCKLDGSDFSRASMDAVNFGGCSLVGANLDHARARSAFMTRAILARADLTGADLMEAILSNADVSGADFKGANLFRADFMGSRGDDETSFDKANLELVRHKGALA